MRQWEIFALSVEYDKGICRRHSYLAQQVLSSNLKARIQQESVLPHKMGRNILSISHLFYADDVLVFSNGSQRSLTRLMDLFRVYQQASGQLISNSKKPFLLGR